MRGSFSNLSLLPFHSDRYNRYNTYCPTCSPPIKVPLSKGVPSFELRFIDQGILAFQAFLIDSCTNAISQVIFLTTESVTLEDGTEVTYYRYNGTAAVAPGTYYISIPFATAYPYSVYSEDFEVCEKEFKYKLEWTAPCEDESQGITDFQYELCLDDLDWNKPIVEQIFEEKTNLNGRISRSLVSTKVFHNFSIAGTDYFFESLKRIETFNNATLTNQFTGEVISLDELSITSSDGGCEFPITIQYLSNITTSKECCDDLDLLIDDACDDTVDPNEDCDNYEVNIQADLVAGTLTANDIGNTGPSSYIWTLNGAVVGNGSSISIGNYGTYLLQGVNGNCSDIDSFSHLNPCNNITLLVNVNGATIAGSASGDSNIVITICNSNGVEIGTGLPFTVPESEGDGTFVVKATGDNCEAQQAVFVRVTPPLICEHSLSIAYDSNTNVLTGSNSGCNGTIDNEFIELEDENGTVTVVSNTNTHTISQTGIYWYNATCDGCLLRIRRLVIIETECPDNTLGTCDNPLYVINCEKDSGEDTKVILPQ